MPECRDFDSRSPQCYSSAGKGRRMDSLQILGRAMKQHKGLKSILIFFGLIITSSAFSHPYDGPPDDAPLTFILHATDDGRPIYTNIPKKCFSKGVLTCHQLHPIFKGSGTIKKPEI